MNVTDKDEFATLFVERYAKRGFGSMNKNDFEVLIYDLLKRHGDLKDKSNYAVSMDLQIPETKVRRLAYESDLKYGQLSKEELTVAFFKIIAKSKFRGDLGKIEFVIESKFIRTSIAAKLKELGHYADSSFNSEIIRIHHDSFVELLHEFYPDKAIERIVKECNQANGSNVDAKWFLDAFMKGIVEEAGKSTLNLGKLFFAGGFQNVDALVSAIKGFLS